MLDIDWESIRNPILDQEPEISVRRPAIYFHDGNFYLFYTSVMRRNHQYFLHLELITSSDLIHWSPSQRIVQSDAGFSSPGNVLRVEDKWILCHANLSDSEIPRLG